MKKTIQTLIKQASLTDKQASAKGFFTVKGGSDLNFLATENRSEFCVNLLKCTNSAPACPA